MLRPRFDLYDNDYKKKFKYFVDRMHLHPEGNRLIAEGMLDPIKKVIQKMKPASIKSS